MRIVIWSLIALALAASPLALRVADHWGEAGALIARAESEGLLGARDAGPLSPLERAVVVAEFERTWGRRGRPCRALDAAAFGRLLAGGEERLPERAVSDALAGAGVFAGGAEPEGLRGHYKALLISCRLERTYTDEELLRMWLPRADFGEGARGVESAAQAHFGKDAADLDAHEAARLAALLRNPSYYLEQESAWSARASRIRERLAARGERLD